MSFHRPICLLGAIFVGAWLPAERMYADDWTDQARPKPALNVTLRNGEMIGSEPVRRAYVTSGTNELVFVVPPGFRMDASNPEKIVLGSADNSCFLTFRIADPAPADTQELKPDAYREVLLSRYAGAKILDEFSRTAANHSGPAFDLQWRNSGGALQSTRTAFIPAAAGVLEFALVANSDKFKKSEYFFNLLLLSLRTNEGGKLEIAPVPGNS